MIRVSRRRNDHFDDILLAASNLDGIETQQMYDDIFAEYEADPSGRNAIPHDVVMRESRKYALDRVKERHLRDRS